MEERESRERVRVFSFPFYVWEFSLSFSPLSSVFSIFWFDFRFIYYLFSILIINNIKKKKKLSIVGVEEQWRVIRSECGGQLLRLADAFFNYFSWYSGTSFYFPPFFPSSTPLPDNQTYQTTHFCRF